MRLQQAVVDCGDNSEEGDWGFLLLIGKERRCEAVPDGVDGEGKHELDCAAGEQGGQEGVDGAVDVVQWQDV